MVLNFRTLKANEIDVRVGTVNAKGATLLLYKDARVDMTILDETVGPMNWQRHHSRDNANCIISIWNDEIKCWVDKEDTGVESNTEKEKGLASDSFKRAGTNWGIGRELYTAPFIFVGCETVKNDNGKGHQLKNKYEFFDIKVTDIGYNDDREIIRLVIGDKNGKAIYTYGCKTKNERKPEVKGESFSDKSSMASEANGSKKITSADVKSIEVMAKEVGSDISNICKAYGISKLEDMNWEQWSDCTGKLRAKKQKMINEKIEEKENK